MGNGPAAADDGTHAPGAVTIAKCALFRSEQIYVRSLLGWLRPGWLKIH